VARRLNVWWGAAIAGCVVVAAVYLPPRGTTTRSRGDAVFGRYDPPSPEQARSADLAHEWQRAELALRFAELRRSIAPELDRRRDQSLPTVVLRLGPGFSDDVRAWLPAQVDSTWRQLGLGTTKIGVGLVLELHQQTPATGAHPRPLRSASPAYFPPDSLDRHTCLSLTTLVPGRHTERLFAGAGGSGTPAGRELQQRLRRMLGPCAFLAAFGKPSPTIERWLAARRYDLAVDASWDLLPGREQQPWWLIETSELPPSQRRWIWQFLYRSGPGVVGCLGGREAACAAFATRGASVTREAGGVVATTTEWRSPPLPGATELLAAALREFGSARFARFWTADLPPDSAFRVAMDTSLGRWMAGRQRALGTTLELGPAVPFDAALLGVLVTLVVLGGAAAYASRRQIG
jgi:hypothetical protein